MTGVGGPSGLVGGFGDVGEARLAAGMARLQEIEQNVEHDAVNSEKYIRELSKVCGDMFRATGAMFEQEHLRFINMFTAAGSGGNGGGYKYPKAIMEHKVIQNLRAVNGDKWLFRQRHQKFTTALGQIEGSHEEIVHRLVREIDLGKEMEKVVTGLRADYGDEFEKASGDVWNILIDKAEMEAYDNIQMVPKGQGVVAYGVMCRWSADVSGLGLAEQARRLMRPDPPKK